MGDDAAGRGMATGFAIVLGPTVILAGVLLFWGTRGGPRQALWAGFCLVAAPVAYGAVTFSGGMSRGEPLRLLLAAGAPPAVNAMAPERTMRSVSEHDLVLHIIGIGHAGALLALDTLLGAGAGANVVDADGRPISMFTPLPALEILKRHGADFTPLDTRTDRLTWNALMNAVYLKQWAEALFFIQEGLSPDYTAPDGKSARTILAEVDPRGSTYRGDAEVAHTAFLVELKQRPSSR